MSVAAMMSPQPHHHPHPPHLLRRRTVRIGGTSDLGLGPRQESTEIAHEHGGDQPGTIGALIASYMRSAGFIRLRDTSKKGYMTRLEAIRIAHGARTISGLSRERILKVVLQPYADRPAAALDTLKKLRILIRHAIDIGMLASDPSAGIKRPKTKEIRAWTDAELAAFERRWPLGTKQRTAYALMLNVGAARADVHLLTPASAIRRPSVFLKP
jgi:hypothetical protein